MRIQFEIKERLPEIIDEILHSGKWVASIKECDSEGKFVVIKDPVYNSEAPVEIRSSEILIVTAWSRYVYRIYAMDDLIFCEYTGAYRGLLEQYLLPTLTPRGNLLDSDVFESSLYGHEHRKLREYAEDNLKLKQFRREHFNEGNNGTAGFDHPHRVYDEFIKEDYIVSENTDDF